MDQRAVAAVVTDPRRAADTPRFVTDRRRWLQLALAAIWIIDGLLQCQTFMFTPSFAKNFLGVGGGGDPAWVTASIHWAWGIVAASPVLGNAAFATLQLALGFAISWRPAVKVGLAASIVWSLVVWWFGEDLGGLLSGHAGALSGAPGAVLLYAILAVLLWPTGRDTSTTFVAAQSLGLRTAKVVWLVLWVGLASLNIQPANLSADAVHSMVAGMGERQPGWVAGLVNGFAALSAHHGAGLNIAGAVVLALIGVGIFLPVRWIGVVVVAAIVVSAFIWVIGQALGEVFGGESTDINSGPLLALIALAYWPSRPPAVAAQTAGAKP
jgi:hypothetical protein